MAAATNQLSVFVLAPSEPKSDETCSFTTQRFLPMHLLPPPHHASPHHLRELAKKGSYDFASVCKKRSEKRIVTAWFWTEC
eukprot:7486323-Karenia_brevis.AAC.1